MKRVLLIAGMVLSQSLWAGELFSFDKTAVIFSALQHIKLRYSDLAKVELSPYRYVDLNEKDGKLFVSVFFSYKADNTFGVLYTCVKLNENGELIKIQRDIKPNKGIFDGPMPNYAVCS